MPTQKKTWISAFGFIVLMVTAVAWAAPVPDTGQIKCYNATAEITCPSSGRSFYGQDAHYRLNPMSYTKLDGSGNALSDSVTSWVMVRDNVTGLVWEMKTDDGSIHDKDNTYTWYFRYPVPNGGNPGTPGSGTDTEDFIKALNDALYGGYNDWRLPTIKELGSIANYSISSPEPTITTGYFPNTVPSFYWSSTTYVAITVNAWNIDFDHGNNASLLNKLNSCHVRAVRGGQSGSLGSYTDNGDGTVTDISTGLMWQQTGSPNTRTWEQALADCAGLSLGGHSDWRLPTNKELRSLVDFSRDNPAINTTYFPNAVLSSYWSSTTYAIGTKDAWGVYFGNGWDNHGNKSDSYNLRRAVRGGQSVATPGIKANGQAGQITVSSGTPVSITASLAPGNENGKSADWWIAESTPWGLYTFSASGWSPGINMLFQYPIIRISPVEIFNGSLPAGDYAFYFVVDMSPNGVLDSPFYYDFVQVHVTQ